MLRKFLIAAAAATLMSACSSGVSRTVEHPAEDVRTMIQANEPSLSLTHYFPSANHKTEHAPDGLVWHFTLNDLDYARMVITLDPKGVQQTHVSSRFEDANDAVGPGIPFLRKTARATGEEILAATLDGRPVDLAMLQKQLKIEAAKDPQAMARGYMEASAEMFKQVQAAGETFSATSEGAVRGSQSYDQKQPYDRTPAYDRNSAGAGPAKLTLFTFPTKGETTCTSGGVLRFRPS